MRSLVSKAHHLIKRSRSAFWLPLAALGVLALAAMACNLPSAIESVVKAGEGSATPAVVATPSGSVALQLAPDRGIPGARVTVSGQRWQPDSTVLLRLENPDTGEGQQSVYASATVSAGGTFTALVDIPADVPWPGASAIQVRAWSAGSGQSAVALFYLEGSIVTTPSAGSVTPEPGPATVSPANSATPVPPTPTVPAAAPLEGAVTSAGINLRSGPGAAYNVITVLQGGARFSALGQNLGGDWLYVRVASGQLGWLYRTFTDYRGTVEVVAAPLPPTAAPTAMPAPTATPTRTPIPIVTGWRGEYYINVSLSGAPWLVRDDPAIGFNWGTNAPAPGLPADNFSARWTRTVNLGGGTYRFHATADDGFRLWVDGVTLIDQWRDGSAHDMVADVRLDAGDHSLRVEYYERMGNALAQLWWERLSSYPDWKGEYYSNVSLAGSPALVRNDSSVNFNWGGSSPDTLIPVDNFSARWTRSAQFDAGTYRFHLLMDDGGRVWVDNNLLIDEWHDAATHEVTADMYLAGGSHTLRVEYYERTGGALVQFRWELAPYVGYPDWKAEYWSNQSLSGAPDLVRNDPAVNFNWGEAAAGPNLPSDHFSARWTRWATFPAGTYRFAARADDGIRVFVDGRVVIDQWHDSAGTTTYTSDLALSGPHWIEVDYYENAGAAVSTISWTLLNPTRTPSPTNTATARPTATSTATVKPTATPTTLPAATKTATATPTTLPVATKTPTATPTTKAANPTAVPPTATRTTVPTARPTQTPTSLPAATRTPTSRPTATPTALPTAVPTRLPTATPTATARPVLTPSTRPTATPTVLPLAGVRLSEILSTPSRVDWNGDGTYDMQDQWVELHNTGQTKTDLSGWSIEVVADAAADGRPAQAPGKPQAPRVYVFKAGTTVQAGGVVLLFGDDLGWTFAQGDQLRLVRPNGRVVDSVVIPALLADRVYARDAAGAWRTDWLPSPGEPNGAVKGRDSDRRQRFVD